MSKSTISRLFFGAIVAEVAGWVVAIFALLTAIASGAITIGGENIVTVNGGPFASSIGLLLMAAVLMTIGAVAGVASWVGALYATSRLEDKTWFVILLVLGLWSFGFIAMVAYVVAGPHPFGRDDRRGLAAARGA
jgi:hypothetical protein